MLEFSCKKRDKQGVPIMSAVEMEELGSALVKDYKPALIKDPQPINYEHFLECYLGAKMQYRDIRLDKFNEEILGLTAFGDGAIPVFDPMLEYNIKLNLTEGSVVISNKLFEDSQEGRLRFTVLHEAGHWWCHRSVFYRNKYQLCLFEVDENMIIVCREKSIENFAYRKRTSSNDWMEYQADYLAAAIAMPKDMFKVAAGSVLKNAGINEGFITTGICLDYDMFAQNEFPSLVANVFDVSKKAAEIKLRNFGYIKNIVKIEEEAKQGTLF